MTKTYRNKFEIINSILTVLRKHKVPRTQLMYLTFMSYAQINKYVTDLENNELIKQDKQNDCYLITSKGTRFLEMFKELKKMY